MTQTAALTITLTAEHDLGGTWEDITWGIYLADEGHESEYLPVRVVACGHVDYAAAAIMYSYLAATAKATEMLAGLGIDVARWEEVPPANGQALAAFVPVTR